MYNVTVRGLAEEKNVWLISGNFATTEIGASLEQEIAHNLNHCAFSRRLN